MKKGEPGRTNEPKGKESGKEKEGSLMRKPEGENQEKKARTINEEQKKETRTESADATQVAGAEEERKIKKGGIDTEELETSAEGAEIAKLSNKEGGVRVKMAEGYIDNEGIKHDHPPPREEKENQKLRESNHEWLEEGSTSEEDDEREGDETRNKKGGKNKKNKKRVDPPWRKNEQDWTYMIKAEAAAIRRAELLNTMVSFDKFYSEEEVEITGGKKKITKMKRSRNIAKMALVAKRLDDYKDVIVWQNEDSKKKMEWIQQRKLAIQSQSPTGNKSQSQKHVDDNPPLGDCENDREPS